MALDFLPEDFGHRAMPQEPHELTEDFWRQYTTGIVLSPSLPATSNPQDNVMRSSNGGDALTPPSSSTDDDQARLSGGERMIYGIDELATSLLDQDRTQSKNGSSVSEVIFKRPSDTDQAAPLVLADAYPAGQSAPIQLPQDSGAYHLPMYPQQSLEQTNWTELSNWNLVYPRQPTAWGAAGLHALPKDSYIPPHQWVVAPFANDPVLNNDIALPLQRPIMFEESYNGYQNLISGIDTTASMLSDISSYPLPPTENVRQQLDHSVADTNPPAKLADGPELYRMNAYAQGYLSPAMVLEQSPYHRIAVPAVMAAFETELSPKSSSTLRITALPTSKTSLSDEDPSSIPQGRKRQRNLTRRSRHARHQRTLRTTNRTVLTPESSTASSLAAPSRKAMVGGRQGRLAEGNRVEAGNMRKTGACWPCTIMRERCSEGDPCQRCAAASHRSKIHGLGCDRRQLKGDMMRSFIPVTMGPGQHFQSYLDYLSRDARGWSTLPQAQEGIKVPFFLQYGSPLEWTCHEYEPSPENSLRSLSYNKMSWNDIKCEHRDNSWQRTYTPSAPLAIKYLDVDGLNAWVKRMIEQRLEDIGDMYYWEGHQLRLEIIKALCQLYDSLRSDLDLKPGAQVLRDDLRRVISLLLVTYVMKHAFTVKEQARGVVIQQLSKDNDPSLYPEMLILETAVSQLHYGFSKLLYSMHLDLLVRLQQILKHAKYKEWWLSAFGIMLGLALCLEEYQHLLHIQADGDIVDGQEQGRAIRDAQNDCDSIDDGFEFLLRLYHYKYSVRSQTRASFALWKNRTTHEAEAESIESVSLMFARHRVVLLQRKDLKVSVSEDNHILRFVGRFLTSVM